MFRVTSRLQQFAGFSRAHLSLPPVPSHAAHLRIIRLTQGTARFSALVHRIFTGHQHPQRGLALRQFYMIEFPVCRLGMLIMSARVVTAALAARLRSARVSASMPTSAVIPKSLLTSDEDFGQGACWYKCLTMLSDRAPTHATQQTFVRRAIVMCLKLIEAHSSRTVALPCSPSRTLACDQCSCSPHPDCET